MKNIKRVSVLPVKHREIFEIFHEIFYARKFHEILRHYSYTWVVQTSWSHVTWSLKR